MNQTEPRPIPADFRVMDRSDRVWFYGFARMIPLVMWLGGIGLMIFVVSQFRPSPAVALPMVVLVFAVPIVLDRSKILDPVEYINFGEYVMVKRIVSKRSLPFERVRQIEFSTPDGEDFDDKNKGRRMKDVTIRFRRAWPAKLNATGEDAVSIADWANAYGLKLVESEQRGPRDQIDI